MKQRKKREGHLNGDEWRIELTERKRERERERIFLLPFSRPDVYDTSKNHNCLSPSLSLFLSLSFFLTRKFCRDKKLTGHWSVRGKIVGSMSAFVQRERERERE